MGVAELSNVVIEFLITGKHTLQKEELFPQIERVYLSVMLEMLSRSVKRHIINSLPYELLFQPTEDAISDAQG